MNKRLLFTFLISLATSVTFAQVMAGQTDNFTDGTTQGWAHGAGSPNPPTNQTAGGFTGNYVQNTSIGGGGPGSRHAFYNRTQWAGDYTTSGIQSISMDVRNSSATETLYLRIGFADDINFAASRWISTNSTTIPPGGGWTNVTFSTLEADLSLALGSETYNTVMSSCVEIRIISAQLFDYRGDIIVGSLDVDNITAQTTLNTENFEPSELEFKIAPNPAKERMNIQLPAATDNGTIEVFSVLGKRVYHGNFSGLNTTLNIRNWKSGLYLVKISTETTSQTKRFIKQ